MRRAVGAGGEARNCDLGLQVGGVGFESDGLYARWMNDGLEEKRDAPDRDLILFVGATGLLLALMAGWYFYPYPSGKTPGVVDFILFWGREALMLVFFAVAAVVGALIGAWRLLRRVIKGWRSAPLQD